MTKEDLVRILEKKGYVKSGNFLIFDGFKKFKITKSYIKNIGKDQLFIIESNNKIFEYWIDQELLIPPWETHWFQLEDPFLMKLKGRLLKYLISQGIKKAGNIFKFTKEIGMSYPTFYNFFNKKQSIEMISVGKLRRILKYLNIKYSEFNDKIEYTKKGNKISIVNPKFPIDLSTNEGAKILGHIVSDGCIYTDKKANNSVRTKYSTGEKESIETFISLINSVYGNTHVQRERIRNCDILRIGSSIIGKTLLKVGAISGQKASVDGSVPWLIVYGSRALKRNYLQAVFDDESGIYIKDGGKSYITMTRYRHIKEIGVKQKNALRKIEKFMNCRKFPTGHVNKTITIKRALEKTNNQISDLLYAPKLLMDEQDILKEFDIESRMYGTSLTKTMRNKYSVSHSLFINKKKSVINFHKEINFSLNNKREKLERIIEKIGEKNAPAF